MAKLKKVKIKRVRSIKSQELGKEPDVKFCKCGMWLPEGRMCDVCGDINFKQYGV
jgi:hypothetical protein